MSDWREIPGYNGAYQISRDGEVRTWRYRKDRFLKEPKILTPYMRKQGKQGRCRFVKLTSSDGTAKDVKVLRLMVDVWLGGCPINKVPYHKNGDLNDNCINNIGFATRESLGRMTGSESKRMPVAKIDRYGEVVEIYPSARQAAKDNHMSYQTVLDRCNRKVKNPFALDGHNYIFAD